MWALWPLRNIGAGSSATAASVAVAAAVFGDTASAPLQIDGIFKKIIVKCNKIKWREHI